MRPVPPQGSPPTKMSVDIVRDDPKGREQFHRSLARVRREESSGEPRLTPWVRSGEAPVSPEVPSQEKMSVDIVSGDPKGREQFHRRWRARLMESSGETPSLTWVPLRNPRLSPGSPLGKLRLSPGSL